MRAALLAIAAVACKPPARVEPVAAPPAGLSILMYGEGDRWFAVIDDRRTIDVRRGEVVLDQIAEGASLASLVVEPASAEGQGLVVDTCRREAAPRDVVRCTARGATGRVFVRVLYVSAARAAPGHVVTVAGEAATIVTRLEIALPAWGRRATLALFDGVPGGARPPAQLGALDRVLDGGTAVIQAPVRRVSARRLVVFDPTTDVESGDREDGAADRRTRAWEWVELAGVGLLAGPIDLLVDEAPSPIDVDALTAARAVVDGNLRVPLRADQLVRGTRERQMGRDRANAVIDHFTFVVSNADTRPRLVIVEEQLRTAKRRTVISGSPRQPLVVDDLARLELEIPAGGTARARFSIQYEL